MDKMSWGDLPDGTKIRLKNGEPMTTKKEKPLSEKKVSVMWDEDIMDYVYNKEDVAQAVDRLKKRILNDKQGEYIYDNQEQIINDINEIFGDFTGEKKHDN